jgi:hypothetical protein
MVLMEIKLKLFELESVVLQALCRIMGKSDKGIEEERRQSRALVEEFNGNVQESKQ